MRYQLTVTLLECHPFLEIPSTAVLMTVTMSENDPVKYHTFGTLEGKS